MASHRPRRTRIYGANYDIGESYYKKQLDELDNKHKRDFSSVGESSLSSIGKSYDSSNSRVERESLTHDFRPFAEERFPSKVTFHNTVGNDDDLQFSRNNASMKRLDDVDFGSTMHESSSILRASKISGKHDDFLKETNDFGLKSERSAFVDDLEDQMESSSRRFKMRSAHFSEDSVASTASVAANSRAKASKARLAELESEMQFLTDKHHEREQRSKHLKKLLDESDFKSSSVLEKIEM